MDSASGFDVYQLLMYMDALDFKTGKLIAKDFANKAKELIEKNMDYK